MMIEIIFRYKKQDFDMKYNEPRRLKDLVEEFAKQQSLEPEKILLLYKGTKVNIETELMIEEQFGLTKLKTKKRLKFFVCRESPYQIIFNHPEKKTIFEVKLNEAIKDVFTKYALKAGKELSSLYFLYGGESYNYENSENKTVNEIMSSDDKIRKVMTVIANERAKTCDSIKVEEEPRESINNINEKEELDNSDNNSLEENFLSLEEDFESSDLEPMNVSSTKKFYLYNFLIFLIQYAFIMLLTIVGFEYKFNEILLGFNISLVGKYMIGIGFFFALAFIMVCLARYKRKRSMIIFHVFYPILIIYFEYLLSAFINTKYITIGLSLVWIQIFSLLINIFFKNAKTKYICLFSVISSLLGLVLFSFITIKSFWPILYISIFWLISNMYFILWIFFVIGICELEEYFYSSLIFNYGIFFLLSKGILFVIKHVFNYINERNNEDNKELKAKKKFYLNNFIILVIHFSLIIILTMVGFEYKLNERLIELDISLKVKYIPFLALIFLSSIIINCLHKKQSTKWLLIFHAIYPSFIVYYSFLLSSFIDTKYIKIGLYLIEIQIFSLLFNVLLKKFELKHFLLFSSSLSLLGMILFSAFWIQSWLPILFMSIFYLVSICIYISIIYMINKYCHSYESIYSTLMFNYSIFLGIILLIYKIYKCISSICKKRMNDEKNGTLFKVFGLLLIQYVIIIILTLFGFDNEFNDELKYNITLNLSFFIAISISTLLISIHLLMNIEEQKEGGCWIFYFILYIPIMILLYFLFSYYTEEKYISSFMSIIFFELLSIFLCLFFGSSNFSLIPVSCVISNMVTILPLHFYWLKNGTSHMWLWILGGLGDIYFSVIAWFFQYKNCLYFPVVCFDYGIFALIIFLIKSFYTILGKCCTDC